MSSLTSYSEFKEVMFYVRLVINKITQKVLKQIRQSLVEGQSTAQGGTHDTLLLIPIQIFFIIDILPIPLKCQ